MRERLRAGVAIYNAGHYHAAHDAWEAHWLELERESDDERLFHGLIQFTAAVHHARNRNWEGCVGLASSALDYLEGLPADYREVDLAGVRRALSALASDPEIIERRPPPRIVLDGERPTLADLSPEERAIAAPILADELGYDEEIVEGACEYALVDLEAGEEGSRFLALVADFLAEDDHRGIVYDRLRGHVERREAKERDVEGLF
ncbi:DUF309 domain-containing protein [Saliphagus sp. LR7]|uniref:DUF309 domain-containing protein n=1 Tax=Saliphagus sp. LR7 TaxID=2282654 RepID=UPI000DF7E676|nr:DUF309 domain-containing protein [Saliphagus sp. LR7]